MKKDKIIEVDRDITSGENRYEFRDQGVEYTLVVNKQEGSITLHTKARTDNFPLRGVSSVVAARARGMPPFFYASYEIKSYYEELYGIPVTNLFERIATEFSSEEVLESGLRDIIRDIDAKRPDKAYFGVG